MCKEKLNETLKFILKYLIAHHYIGGKHTPEGRLVKPKIKRLKKDELREFKNQYKSVQPFLIRTKKRTGKDYDWHISINPRNLGDVFELLGE